jgi:hypothetical protein
VKPASKNIPVENHKLCTPSEKNTAINNGIRKSLITVSMFGIFMASSFKKNVYRIII